MIFSTLRQSALAAAEYAINTALEYDPATQQGIEELDGKVLSMESTLPPLTLFVVHSGGKVHLHSHWDTEPETVLRGSLPALAAVAVRGGDRLSLANSGVSTRGDEDVLRQVSRLLKRLDIDWEGLLANLIGDVPANMVGQSARSARAWASDSGERLSYRAQLAATEELRLLPSRVEVEHWYREVTLLRQDAERLAARVAQLRPSDSPMRES